MPYHFTSYWQPFQRKRDVFMEAAISSCLLGPKLSPELNENYSDSKVNFPHLRMSSSWLKGCFCPGIWPFK